MNVKVGDVVHVRGEVLEVRCDSGEFLVACRDEANNPLSVAYRAVVSNDRVVHVEPRPLKVGDRVKDDRGYKGIIVAQCRGEFWVDYGDDGCFTWGADELERA